jgi:acyl-CoA thioesterase FadM
VRGFDTGTLHDRYRLEFTTIDCSSLIFGAVAVTDEVLAAAEPVGPRYFNVTLAVRRGERTVVVVRSRVTVLMLRRPGDPAELPEELLGMAVDKIDRIRTAVESHDPEFEARDLDERITNDGLGWHRSWRVATHRCHYAGRVHYAGYLRILEELAEMFLADRGITTRDLIQRHGLLPMMQRVRVRVLADAYAGDRMHTTYEIHQVVGGKLFDCRFDAHVERDGRRIPTATGILLAGFTGLATPDGRPVTPPAELLQRLTPDVAR